jgi:4'-phosphopantetheinyl transferase
VIDEAHVWLVSLDGSPNMSLLSADERDRARRYRAPEARDRFVLARAALREILGGYVGLPPEQLRFAYPCACGRDDCEPSRRKPRVEPDTLRFNVSHTEGLALIAVSRGRELGVDVERVRPLAAAATWALDANEAEAIAALPEPERLDAFYRAWTRREAHAKARGDGLAPTDERGRWWFVELTPTPGYRAALAVEGGPCAVLTRSWP